MKTQKPKYKVGRFAVRVKRSATGKGLFAEEAIPKGSFIIEYIGRPASKAEAEDDTLKYLFETGRGTIDGNVKENIARYINHSCAPNCDADGPRGRVFISALRTIKPGEELVYHYGKEYFDTHLKPIGCRCVRCTRTSRPQPRRP